MSSVEFHPNNHQYSPILEYKRPNARVEILSIDHTLINYDFLQNWGRDCSCEIKQYKGFNYVGLPANSTYATVNLSHGVEIVESGDYWIMIYGKRQAIDGAVTLSIDDNVIRSLDSKHTYEHPHWFDYGVVNLTAGNRDFYINVTKGCYVFGIAIYKIDKYVGKNGGKAVKNRLDVQNISNLTHNTINEMNTATIEIANHNEYLAFDENYSGLQFEYLDHINVYIGSNSENMVNMFGGYIIDPTQSDDNSKITLDCADRLFDLKYRNYVYNNFLIGKAVASSASNTNNFPTVHFSSALETLRYLAEASIEKGLKAEKFYYPYGFNLNFGNQDDFNQVEVDGFYKKYETKEGMPAPSMMLTLDEIPIDVCGGTNTLVEAVLYENYSDPWDANIYDILGLSYMAPSCACDALTKLQMNIGIEMYKTGQNEDNAVEYNIAFTGKSGVPHLIGSIPQYLNNAWQTPKFNLKTAFDKYAKSSNYYITKVRLWDTVNSSQLANKHNMILYLDNILSYNNALNANISIEQATSKSFDVMQTILAQLGYVLYVEYSDERRDDILVCAPASYEQAEIEAVEGKNIYSITNHKYDPVEYVANKVLIYTHPSDSVTASSSAIDIDGFFRWQGSLEYFEDLSDVKSQSEGNTYANNYLNQNKTPSHSYTLEMEGTTLIKPSDWLLTKIDNKPLSGDYPLLTLSYDLNFDDNQFKTKVDAGRVSQYFYRRLKDMYLKIEQNEIRNSRNVYNNKNQKTVGTSGIGSITKSGG